jgi:hypothetical protein
MVTALSPAMKINIPTSGYAVKAKITIIWSHQSLIAVREVPSELFPID